MNVFITMDYEVFFGEKSGSVNKCMVEPANELMKLAASNSFRITFFWDIGHFLALQKFAIRFPELSQYVKAIRLQVEKMIREGHDVQLHIHPHWEKAIWENCEWKMNLENHYKLSDFPENERIDVFAKYKRALEEITKVPTKVFRAGGWCIQPFTDFQTLFLEHDIRIDSSVMPGAHWQSEQYNIDFRKISSMEPYAFSTDVCQIDLNGDFTEYPISTRFYSPLFFWKLYVLGRLFPAEHKMWGDGNFIAQPGGKKELLTKGKLHHVSTDGFFAAELENSFRSGMKQKQENMVIIGHPKSLTKYSLKKLAEFTARKDQNKRFMTLSETL